MIILVLRTKVDLQFVPFGDNPCKYEYTVCLKKKSTLLKWLPNQKYMILWKKVGCLDSLWTQLSYNTKNSVNNLCLVEHCSLKNK